MSNDQWKMHYYPDLHAFGLSPFLPYNAPLCYLKAGNWLCGCGIKAAVFDPVQQREFLSLFFSLWTSIHS
jgi:hypothetical protein